MRGWRGFEGLRGFEGFLRPAMVAERERTVEGPRFGIDSQRGFAGPHGGGGGGGREGGEGLG